MVYIIKNLPYNLRPRERLKNIGTKYLSDAELLAIVLRTGYKSNNVIDVASSLLSNYSLFDLSELSLNELERIPGIGEVKAITILAAIELGRRSLIKINLKEKITNSKDVYNLFYKDMCNLKQEHLIVIFLDIKNYIINKKVVFIGTVNKSIVHPRDIFREAVSLNACNIIVIHNHPSGDVEPSYNDDFFTSKLVSLGKMMGIYVIDHIIFGNNNYYSYLENGYDFNEKE